MKYSSTKKTALCGSVLLASIFWSAQSFGYQWERTFGEAGWEQGYSVQQTTDGGYIIVGDTSSVDGFGDVYLVKTNADGDETWSKTFGTPYGWDSGRSVQQTTDGGYIIAGSISPFPAPGYIQVYLIKTDADGDEIWSKAFGGDGAEEGYSVQQTTDGGYIIAGSTSTFDAGTDVYLIKTDAAGNEIWSKTFGGTEADLGYSVQQTTDGGYIIAGITLSFGAGEIDVYLIKTDADGNEIWSKTFGGTDWDYGNSVQQTTDGGYIIAGYTFSFGAGRSDVYLIKTDADDEIWSKTIGGTDWDYGESVQQTTDGGYIIAGWTSVGGGDVYLVKTDADGNEIWSKAFGGVNYEVGYSVQQTTDGGYIIAGLTDPIGAGLADVYLVYYDPQPQPDIKANGSDEPITVSYTTPVSITVSLDPGQHDGQNADMWVVAHAPLSPSYYWYSYVHPTGWLPGIEPAAQAPLFDLSPPIEVLNRVLPLGDYTFYFAVDDNADGLPDGTWLDSVEVYVRYHVK